MPLFRSSTTFLCQRCLSTGDGPKVPKRITVISGPFLAVRSICRTAITGLVVIGPTANSSDNIEHTVDSVYTMQRSQTIARSRGTECSIKHLPIVTTSVQLLEEQTSVP